MKKKITVDEDGMRSEYDLSNGRPSPYAARIRQYGSNLVVIEPELYTVFPSSAAVNAALRLIVKASTKAVKTKAVKQAKAN